MASIDGFDELAEELDELANAYDDVQKRRGTSFSARDGIERGVEKALDEEIVPEAKRNARRHVPSQDAETIDHESGGWVAGRYQHYFFATSDLVRYHEYGTGGRATDPSRGTTNAVDSQGRPGYIIRPTGNKPLSFFWDELGENVAFEYVVHPGVYGKHFMREAVENNENELRGYILSQINRVFRRNDL